jgi:phosphoenolpyruvate phosphomutase
MIKAIESHNGLSAKLVDACDKYNGVWISSLTESASKGLPDNELISLDSRLDTIREIRRATGKTIILDGDTGGSIEHFPHVVQEFEKAGVDILMIEDKVFPKKNSLLEDAGQVLEDVDVFAIKIATGKKHVKNMKIMARIESLIAKKSVFEALIRAEAYVKAGVDGIMIHSKTKVDSSEIMEFATKFKEKFPEVTLVAVPTTYDLPEDHPFDIIIYANMLLRASLKAMKEVLVLDDPKNADMDSVKDIFDIVGY